MIKERFNKTNLLQIDNKLFQKIEEDTYPLGLAYGYTGLSLYLFERAKITGNNLYEKYATQCIEHVYHEFTHTMTLGVYNGYASISLGLNLLSHLGYIKTSPQTFHDINELCFKNMNYVSNKYPDMINKLETNELTLLLDYFCKQFTYRNIRSSEDLAYRKLIIKIIDFLYTERLEDLLNPPLLYTSDNILARYVYGLYEAFHLGIHQTRIIRILDSLSYFVCSLIPIQMASRVQLLYVMLKISTFYNTDIWHKHIKLLHENIDTHSLLKEFYDKALFYDKGLASVILLLDGLNKEFPQFIINYNEKDFYEKIATSLAWKQLLSDDEYFQLHSNLFCGFPGLMEAASYQNNLLPKLLGRNVKYYFVQDTDAVFHRTKYINQAVKNMINTSFFAIWDADVVLPASQIYAAIESLRNKTADVAFPYDGTFLDTSFILREAFIEVGQRISFLQQNQEKMNTIYGPCMCGGGFLISKEKYMYSGLENEQFYGWGCEDTERTERWRTLGFRFFRSDGALFHLSHPRGAMNSKFGSKLHRTRAESTLEESRLRSCKDITPLNYNSYE